MTPTEQRASDLLAKARTLVAIGRHRLALEVAGDAVALIAQAAVEQLRDEKLKAGG